MLEGNMSGPYSVMPAEPVSNASGMLTAFVPTAVTMMNSRLPSADDADGYRLIGVGCCRMPDGGGGAPPDEFEPPQAQSCASSNAAVNRHPVLVMRGKVN